MRALTVDEYTWLTAQPDTEVEVANDPTISLLEAGLVSYMPDCYEEWDGEDWIIVDRYPRTPNGDRAVRVHRAWLASMGGAS